MLHGRSIVGALTALVLTSAPANAGTLPLSALNAGPSSDTVPSSAGDRVATVVYPRRIVDPAIVPVFGDIFPMLTDATEVEAPGQTGLRWRSRALFPGNGANNGRGEIAVMAITDGFDATAAESFVLFLMDDRAAQIHSLQDLADLITIETPGTDYVIYFMDHPSLNAGAGFTDADLLEPNLDDGIVITQEELDGASPDGGGATGQYNEFDLAIVVFSDDKFTGANNAVATEWIQVENDGNVVQPVDADFEFDNRTIHLRMNQQLLDDFDAANPADTVPGNLDIADFRVSLPNSTQLTLATFLAGLTNPNFVASVTVLNDDPESHDELEIVLTNQVTAPADIAAILAARLGTIGADIDSITGNNQTNAVSTYPLLNRPIVPPCPADISGDGMIGFADVNAVLSSFNLGFGEVGYNSAADLDDDNFVGFADLNIVLSAFNTACP